MERHIGSVLVVGAGISGIRSSLDLAEFGYKVILIEKKPHLGGLLAQLDRQFPSDRCGMCKMLPLVEREASSQHCLRRGLFHENIEVLLSTELAGLEGEPGHFQATLKQKPALVDAERCIGCGACSEVCPVDVPDGFNAGLTVRKAIHLPLPHNLPNAFVIDTEACTRCGACERACPSGAIALGLEKRRGFRILVVDDETVVRDSLKEWLGFEGFHVDTAESGEDALRTLTDGSYDLMLLDVKMPGMSGIEVLECVREMHPDLQVVMMTAFATVETAVEAMKLGAREYVLKPFDPEILVALAVKLQESLESTGERQVAVGSVILSPGVDFFDPAVNGNLYGYGVLPHVVTSIEFERMLSAAGPQGGKPLRTADGKKIRKIAWLQCVGSRNLQLGADSCSSVCCMFSLKEAVLAKETCGPALDAALFYMDLRTFGKDFQRYRDKAEKEHHVRFVRSRVHTVEPADAQGGLAVSYSDPGGRMHREAFDLVVLAAGQKPVKGMESLSELTGIKRNGSGFCQVESFSPGRTSREGVLAAGSFSGLRDISESIIEASAASLAASRLIHSKGASPVDVPDVPPPKRDFSREVPKVGVVLCTCGTANGGEMSLLASSLERMRSVHEVHAIERLCTREGEDSLEALLGSSAVNRIVIGACMPCVHDKKARELTRRAGLRPDLVEVVDLQAPMRSAGSEGAGGKAEEAVRVLLAMSVSRLRAKEPSTPRFVPITQRALIVGGGIAGMTAALAIADHGFEVDLIECASELGGNLKRLHRTLEGDSPRELLERTLSRVEKHPLIQVHTGAQVLHSAGRAGDFITTVEEGDGTTAILKHGVTVLATGGVENRPELYEYGRSESVLTQLELEGRLHDGLLDPSGVRSVAMIQCVGSREEPRNYCSRVCCASALKNALQLKEKDPEIEVTIFYRDMMAYGFSETFFTQARRAGVLFVQYEPDRKPQVTLDNGRPLIRAHDPILERDLVVSADVLVLSTGMNPSAGNTRLAEIFGVPVHRDGFFLEVESKWRPLDSLKEGLFMCGVAHAPRSVSESIATAEAAAQRALRILKENRLPVARGVAEVRCTLCSRCQQCVSACPYGARCYDEEEDAIVVDPLSCQGCGACALVCPNGASVLQGHPERQIFAVLDAALDEALL